MLSKRISLLFHLMKSRNYKQGKMSVYLRLTVDSERTEISVQRECEPIRWNTSAGRAIGTKEEIKALNAYLDTMQGKVYEVQRSLIDEGNPVTAENIKNKLLGIKEPSQTILEVFKQHNEQMAQLVGKDFSPLTLKRYKTALDHTRSYIKWKCKTSDIEIIKIDYGFISDFSFWFKSQQNCNHNSTMKYLACFKKLYCYVSRIICFLKALLSDIS